MNSNQPLGLNKFVFQLVCLTCAVTAWSTPRYSFTDLGSSMGAAETTGLAINEAGTVVGGSVHRTDGFAFVYQNRKVQNLNAVNATPGWKLIRALDINDRGDIVGRGEYRGKVRGFRLRNGKVEELDTLTGFPSSVATGIDKKGTVIGAAFKVNSDSQVVAWRGRQAVRLAPELAGRITGAEAVSDNGIVLGNIGAGDRDGDGPFIIQKGRVVVVEDTLVPDSGVDLINGWAVNDRGLVVGSAFFRPANDVTVPQLSRAFAWRNGALTFLPVFPGDENDFNVTPSAYGVNNRGDIVGAYSSPRTPNRAFLFKDQRLYDLNELVSSTKGFRLSTARAINDAGQITGEAFKGRKIHAFLLTPITPRPNVAGSRKLTVSGPTATVHGTCETPVAFIQYRVNGGKWSRARGTSKWKFRVPLRSGRNSISVRAQSRFGYSKPIKIFADRK